MSEKSSTFAPVFERGLNRTNVPRESRIGSLRGQHGGNTWSLPAQSFLRGTLKCTICSTKHIKIHLSGDFFVYVKKKQYFCTMKRILYRHILLLFAVAACVSCSCHSGGKLSLRQAQHVVAQADSLWHEGQMYGIDAGDSATLAQAYETLNSFVHCTSSLRTSFAHACYHYGRLLRAKENPVEAMQAFIAATHSRTRDYHILGRVYSNMGDICHLAGEFQLSYDMFEKSAEIFLKNGDTLLYYYDLNNMAFEKAYLADKQETYRLIRHINNCCTDEEMLSKTIETRAELALRIKEYDSAIYYINELQKNGYCETAGMLIKAQAFSYKSCKDSAVYYSEHVLKRNHTLHETNNALYILTTQDETKDKNSIRSVAADRSDVQKLIEEERSRSAQAVQFLLDNNNKPNRAWVYIAIILIFFLSLVFYRKYWINKKRIYTQVEQIKEKQTDTILQSIKQHIDINDLKNTLHWKNYVTMKADADLYLGGIVTKLENYHLNETEIRFCILTMLNFSLTQIAKTIHYSYPSAIKTLKKRLSIKLGTEPTELHDFLFKLATDVQL